MKKTIFAIGANAALAKTVLPILSQDCRIITAGRKDCDVYCDVTKAITIPDEVDVIINFAASFGGLNDEAITKAVQTNVLGLLNVCKAAHAAKAVHIINISSIFALLNEDSQHYSIYALTKKQGDELAQFYCKLNHIALTTLRPSRIYGDSIDFEKNQPFLFSVIQKAQDGEDVMLYGTNDARRNYIHAVDLAKIIEYVVAKRVEGTFSCLYPSDTTYSQLVRTAQKVFGNGGHLSFVENKPDIPDDIYPPEQSIYQKIDYQPRVSIEAGIARIKTYRERKV